MLKRIKNAIQNNYESVAKGAFGLALGAVINSAAYSVNQQPANANLAREVEPVVVSTATTEQVMELAKNPVPVATLPQREPKTEVLQEAFATKHSIKAIDPKLEREARITLAAYYRNQLRVEVDQLRDIFTKNKIPYNVELKFNGTADDDKLTKRSIIVSRTESIASTVNNKALLTQEAITLEKTILANFPAIKLLTGGNLRTVAKLIDPKEKTDPELRKQLLAKHENYNQKNIYTGLGAEIDFAFYNGEKYSRLTAVGALNSVIETNFQSALQSQGIKAALKPRKSLAEQTELVYEKPASRKTVKEIYHEIAKKFKLNIIEMTAVLNLQADFGESTYASIFKSNLGLQLIPTNIETQPATTTSSRP
jgi:hypothetical protein